MEKMLWDLFLCVPLQILSEVEEMKEPSAQWRSAEHVCRDLKRLQLRVRKIVEDWLDYYRVAVGT